MNIKRFRDPLVAALGALLIGGVSVAMANNHAAPSSAPAANAEEQAGGPDTDNIQEGDQTGAEDAAEGTEGDGTDEQDPNFAGKATIPVDESTLPEDESAEAAALAPLATVSQADAEAAALGAVSGTVTGSALESENGYVVWAVKVQDSAAATQEVKIDAGNGTVLATEAADAPEEAGGE